MRSAGAGKDGFTPTYGQWFVRGCRIFRGKPRSEDESARLREKVAKERFQAIEGAFANAAREYNKALTEHDDGDPVLRKLERKYRRAEKRFKSAERAYRQEKFTNAVRFTGLDLDLPDVLRFSGVVAAIAFLITLLLVLPVAVLGNADIFMMLVIFIPVIMVVPVAVFAFLASYPEMLAKRVRVLSIGRTPETINYMIMSMRLTPSLDRAVAFSSEHSEEPLSSALRKVLWDIYMKKHSSIEEAYMAFANEWGKWDDDFKMSLYAIRAATLEHEADGLSRALDKANEIILTGTKRKVEKFASSLSGPTTVLFSLGILLPLVIGAMLPMLSINMNFGYTQALQTATSGSDNSPIIVIMMDILFPFAALVYAYHILGKRPGTSSPPKAPSDQRTGKRNAIIAGSLSGGVIIGVLGLPFVYNGIPVFGGLFLTLPVLWGAAFSISYFCYATSRAQKIRQDKILEMEGDFPDALFQLGSRIAEGEPLETAFKKVASNMKDTGIAELFLKISYQLRVRRASLDTVLFGKDGLLRQTSSRMINATMRTVAESVKKDYKTAGKTVLGIASYLKDMKKVDHDIRIQLSTQMSMMKSTGVIFAPLVLGITASLYVLISNSMKPISASPMMPDALFFLILGVYLILMLLVILYFCNGIERGDDRIRLKYAIGTALPIAVFIYTVALLLGRGIGG